MGKDHPAFGPVNDPAGLGGAESAEPVLVHDGALFCRDREQVGDLCGRDGSDEGEVGVGADSWSSVIRSFAESAELVEAGKNSSIDSGGSFSTICPILSLGRRSVPGMNCPTPLN